MVYADLHVHTAVSDGTLVLQDLPGVAAEAGLGVVAVTDHDRVHPGLDAPVAERDGLTLISGIELRVAATDQRVDLLGYALSPTDALVAELERIQRDRVERGRSIVACVEDRLDVTLDVDVVEGVGRPHVARAVADHPDTAYERMADVFEDLIGEGDPCYVARDVPSFERGRALLSGASAVVGLAHPLRYPDPGAALDLSADLDAVELHYPYDGPVGGPGDASLALVEAAVADHDLLVTGGSDAHGTTLGSAGLSRTEYERVAAEFPPVP
ncbi:MAG: PHP domain-containing protein [Halanaeroarchaeum sp.]